MMPIRSERYMLLDYGLYRESMLTSSCGVALFAVRSILSIIPQDSKSCSQCPFEGLHKVWLCRSGCNRSKMSVNFHHGCPINKDGRPTSENGRPTPEDGCPYRKMDVPP
jgi:hypothetical protein